MDRTELAALLRQARDRVRPVDVGLPAGARRQVPGLRREEVAQLAGVTCALHTPEWRTARLGGDLVSGVGRALGRRDHRSRSLTCGGVDST
ncbi:hypothetical protein [Nocardia beijingensis]|uniref:Uncharacterized protein n=1 Tax=Nocardia beijingensis TaxID=95162 RepID=A0ABW7W840_9NOCA